jgi:hypothetical protein
MLVAYNFCKNMDFIPYNLTVHGPRDDFGIREAAKINTDADNVVTLVSVSVCILWY